MYVDGLYVEGVCVHSGGPSNSSSRIYVFIGLFSEITAQSQTLPQLCCGGGGANAAS